MNGLHPHPPVARGPRHEGEAAPLRVGGSVDDRAGKSLGPGQGRGPRGGGRGARRARSAHRAECAYGGRDPHRPRGAHRRRGLTRGPGADRDRRPRKLGSFCKILDNHVHLMGAERQRRPPSRPVVVEEGAEVGARAILLPGARIGKGAVVPPGRVIWRVLGAAASGAAEPEGPRPEDRDSLDDAWNLPSRSLAQKTRAAVNIIRAAWYLRACERSVRVRATGVVRVANQGRVRIGDRAVFLGGMIATDLACQPGASIAIGSRSIFNYGVSLEAWSSIRIGDRSMFGSMVRVCDRGKTAAGPVVIGDDVWIAHGAIIEPGVTIGSGSVVAAGSVVSGDVPPLSAAIGNPGRSPSPSLRSQGAGS